MGVLKPDLIMKSIIPVIMSGILSIYGMIVSVILSQKINPLKYDSFMGYKHLASGLCCGLSSLVYI